MANSGAKGGAVMLVALMACGLPAYVLAGLFGAGPVAILSVMVSSLTFISIMGGSLSADLKVYSVVGPLILMGATVPRLVSEANQIAGAVVVRALRH